MLGTGKTTIKGPMGVIDPRTNGAWSRFTAHESKKWINLLLAPSVENRRTFASYYLNWWEPIFQSIDARQDGGVSAAVLLCGEPTAVEAALWAWRNPPGGDTSYVFEMDASTLGVEHTVSSLVGPPREYQGYNPEGTELVKFLDSTHERREHDLETMAEGDMPVPILIFRNICTAHPTAQGILASLAKSGKITSGDGRQVSVAPNAQVIFTAPGLMPAGNVSDVSGNELKQGLIERSGRIGGLSTQILDACVPIYFREPNAGDIIKTASFIAGTTCLYKLRGYNHSKRVTNKNYASPELTADVLELAALEPGQAWDDIVRKLTWAADSLADVDESYAKDEEDDTPPLSSGALWSHRIDNGHLAPTIGSLEDISELSGKWHLPVDMVERCGVKASSDSYWGDLSGVEEKVNKRIFGHKDIVADIFARLRESLSVVNTSQPLISALLVGPTGTGKTALPEAIAEITGHGTVILECNALVDENQLHEAIFGRGEGSLASRVARNPASVVILDEVDKAPPKIWDLLMSALDKGEINDPKTGRRVMLHHAMVFLTSNYLADEIVGASAYLREQSLQEISTLLRKMLSGKKGINPACLARVGGAYLLLPIEGEEALPMWAKFFRQALGAERGDVRISRAGCALAENRHIDAGELAGARSRLDAARRHIGKLGEAGALLKIDDIESGERVLVPEDPELRKFSYTDNPPRGERERLWTPPVASREKMKEQYMGNQWQVEYILGIVAANAMKKRAREPVAALMLAGASGSGKTFLGRQLARVFGKGDPVVIECQQATTPEAASVMLFGDKDGKGGGLLKKVIERKDRVVILDEFTRADPSFRSLVMSMLDDGSATSTESGLAVDMKQCLFIMTTNECEEEMEELLITGVTGDEADAATRAIFVKKGVLEDAQSKRMTFVPITRRIPQDEKFERVRGNIFSALSQYCNEGENPDAMEVEALTKRYLEGADAEIDARSIARWVDARKREDLGL